MAEQGPEQLKVEIVADDKTAQVLEAVRKGFESLAAKQDEVKDGVDPTPQIGHAQESMTVFGGVMLRMGEDIYEHLKAIASEIPAMVHEAFDAAVEETDSIRQLASQFTLMGDGKQTFEELSDAASLYHDELEDIGLAANVSGDAVTSAFAEILYQSDKGVEGVKSMVEELANASRIVPGGMEAISNGMRMMEFGMVKAKNPIVQLIAATDVLHGNAKQVAAQLAKMTPDEQLKKGEEAIHRMSERAKTLPPSFKEIQTTVDNIRGEAFEAVGHEIEASITPAIEDMVGWLRAHKGENEDLLRSIGGAIGTELHDVFEIAHDAFRTLNDHSADLKEAWHNISGDVKASGEVLKAALGGIGDTLVAVTKAYNFLHGAVDTVFGPDEDERKYAATQKKLEEYSANPAKLSQEEESTLRMQFLEAAKASGIIDPNKGGGDPARWADQMKTTHEQERLMYGTPLEQSAEAANPMKFAEVYGRAERAHDEAALSYAATVIAGSADLQAAFLQAAPKLEGGFGRLIDLVQDKSPQFAEALAGLTKRPAQHAMPPVQNFYGGITIKQDFRQDSDPDRVVLTMRRDLVEQAESRRQSRLATPFGA